MYVFFPSAMKLLLIKSVGLDCTKCFSLCTHTCTIEYRCLLLNNTTIMPSLFIFTYFSGKRCQLLHVHCPRLLISCIKKLDLVLCYNRDGNDMTFPYITGVPRMLSLSVTKRASSLKFRMTSSIAWRWRSSLPTPMPSGKTKSTPELSAEDSQR